MLAQVVGFGPSSLGLPLAADRMGELDTLYAQGLRYIDRISGPMELRGSRFPFLIESNSPAYDFMSGVDPDGSFGAVLSRPAARRLMECGHQQVLLRDVSEYLADLADEISRWVQRGGGENKYGCEVGTIRRNQDGTFTTLGVSGNDVLTSRRVVMATGAAEDVGLFGLGSDRYLTSAQLFTGDFDRVDAALASGRPVVVVGGAHSGFASAKLLLARCGGKIRTGQITVIHRTIALHFESLAAFAAAEPVSDEVPMASPVVCTETGQVNRFKGLRGSARDLCLSVISGRQPQVRLVLAGTPAADRAIAAGQVIVHACGYRGTSPSVVEADGTPIPLVRHDGRVAVDASCQVLAAEGPVAGLHGLGIGFARSDPSGVPRVGVNVFHGQDSEDIMRSLLNLG